MRQYKFPVDIDRRPDGTFSEECAMHTILHRVIHATCAATYAAAALGLDKGLAAAVLAACYVVLVIRH
jgi:hypothetical protein